MVGLDDLVSQIENGNLRPRIGPTGDSERLRAAIARLDERGRAVLMLIAEGHDDYAISQRLWVDLKTLRLERPRLIRHLRGEDEHDADGSR